MDERNWNIQIACYIVGIIVGIVALLIYIILAIAGSNTVVVLRILFLFAGIGTIVSAITMGAEILNNDSYGISFFIFANCLVALITTAMQLK